MINPRYLAAKLLDKTFTGGSYSNIQLNSGLEKSNLDIQGKKLCTAIYYGVIQWKITLDYILSKYCTRPLNKMDSIVVTILRCGIYQLLFMNSIPDNAAVNESVALAKQFRKTSASGMVNAVLRNFIRDGKKINCNLSGNDALSVKYSVPVPLIESLVNDYGTETATEFLKTASEPAQRTYIRRNPLKCTHDEFMNFFESHADKILFKYEDKCIYAVSGGDVINTDAFKSGFFHVQGIASQTCCMALNPTENDLVLDICAAPGGKTFTMAEMMNGKGEIHAFDLHEHRVQLIQDGAERLGLENITAKVGDASVFNPDLPKYTKILCDVPCSGLGVIQHKPEIKYKNLADFANLPEIQYKIAENALKYLAVGGEMMYSTCTVRKAENEDVVARLLENHPEIETVENMDRITLLPSVIIDCDGFFITKFRKKY